MAAPSTTKVVFDALQVVGGLLPSSLLEAVGNLKAKHQDAADYEPNLKKGGLRDRIDQAWIDFKALWAEYQRLLLHADHDLAGLHMSRRLLTEVFAWPDLEPVNGWQQGEYSYPITHRAFCGTVPLVLKGISSNQLDKGDPRFGQDGRKRSAHSCLQDCLNADDSANWGVICSGESLRLLHDNPSLVKPAYLAANLRQLVEGEKFDEFAVLWLTLHASRFEHPKTHNCVLDAWKQEAQTTGERALGELRLGVENALEQLGSGFLAHPANEPLRQKLQTGQLSKQEYHGQLLRLIYRFLFLFTAEDRELLFPPAVDRDDPRRQIYREGYSVGRLRDFALQSSAYEGDFSDLWQVQRLVFSQLSRDGSPLGLPGLGGLFADRQCIDLQSCELCNRYLLRAIHSIGWFRSKDSSTVSRVNYRDLNTEELGSVYEGLLELHPEIKSVGTGLELSYGSGAGSERKTSGSYYTPDALVQELIKSALMPVIRDRLSESHNPQEQEAALLGLRVIDPACGSGHFLLAAARRIALELAKVRARDDVPSEADRQHAMREVVSQCIYAVDKNPMAVELCKVALWIEAIEPGKPLGFLDAHIQCGDALVGIFDPKVLDDGIPDEAYKPLTGDDKTVCSSLKKENAGYRKTSRKGGGLQGSLDLFAKATRSQSQQQLEAIQAMPDISLAEQAAKQRAYEQWEQESKTDSETLAAHVYTAAFFLSKTSETRGRVPTSEHLLQLFSGQAISEPIEQAVLNAASGLRFFHWHLRFGEVMDQGGFNCVLGNPPWERIKLQEKEFFAARSEAIATASNKAARDRLIKALGAPDASEADRTMLEEFQLAKREAEGTGEFIRGSERFALTAVGDLNTYALFAEQFLKLITPSGRSGMIVPTGIATDNNTKAYFDEISSGARLVSLFSFKEIRKWFPGTDDRNPFCLLTLGDQIINCQLSFSLNHTTDLSDYRRLFTLDSNDFSLLNPNTSTCPAFRSQMDAELTRRIYQRNKILKNRKHDSIDSWNVNLRTMLHKTNDADKLIPAGEQPPSSLQIYEGKSGWQFDHRYSTFENGDYTVVADSLKVSGLEIQTEYQLSRKDFNDILESYERAFGGSINAFLGFRRVSRSTDERTMVSCILPCRPSTYGWILSLGLSTESMAALCGVYNSLVFDYLLRNSLSQPSIPQGVAEQVAVPDSSSVDFQYVVPRVLELSYTSISLKPWAEDLGYDGQPFAFDPDRRALLRAELDAYYAHLYGLNRDELRYILDPADVMGPDYPSETFRVLKNNEIKEFGEYRTQRLVLEAWDRLFES